MGVTRDVSSILIFLLHFLTLADLSKMNLHEMIIEGVCRRTSDFVNNRSLSMLPQHLETFIKLYLEAVCTLHLYGKYE